MAFVKKILSHVTYSDETENFLRIGLVYYSEKSFAFAIEYLDNYNKTNLSPEAKQLMEGVKLFFGPKSVDPEVESLGGMGNTKLSYPDGNVFFGYIYSIKTGQNALDWYADRCGFLPTRAKLEKQAVPDELEINTPGYDEYLDEYSRKTKTELYDLLGTPTEKKASRYQAKPVYSKNGPTFDSASKGKEVFSGKKEEKVKEKVVERPSSPLIGLPISTAKPSKVPVKISLETAFDVIFEAVLNNEFPEDFIYSKKLTLDEGEKYRIGYVSMLSKKEIIAKFRKTTGIDDLDSTSASEYKCPAFSILSKQKEDDDE